MPPQRARHIEDARAETSTNSKEKILHAATNAGILKGKKTANNASSSLKEAQNASAAPATSGANDAQAAEAGAGINFESLPRSFLHAYRNAHHLPVPSSFKSYHNQAVLSNPNSIGKLSPTMARPASKRRVGKDVLAKAVRRDFMDQGISELDVEAALCYIMRNGNKAFRMRFPPQRGSGKS